MVGGGRHPPCSLGGVHPHLPEALGVEGWQEGACSGRRRGVHQQQVLEAAAAVEAGAAVVVVLCLGQGAWVM